MQSIISCSSEWSSLPSWFVSKILKQTANRNLKYHNIVCIYMVYMAAKEQSYFIYSLKATVTLTFPVSLPEAYNIPRLGKTLCKICLVPGVGKSGHACPYFMLWFYLILVIDQSPFKGLKSNIMKPRYK